MKYPLVYFNEYFRRKPGRLWEREDVCLFTMEPSDENNFEYISREDCDELFHKLQSDLAKANELIEKLQSDLIKADDLIENLRSLLSER